MPPNPFAGGGARFGMGMGRPFDLDRDGLFGAEFDAMYQRRIGFERMCTNCGIRGH